MAEPTGPPEGWRPFGTASVLGPGGTRHLILSREYDSTGLPRWERDCAGCVICDAITLREQIGVADPPGKLGP